MLEKTIDFAVTFNNPKKGVQRIAVLGVGYVGLPTASLFAQAGFCVTAIDINPRIIQTINCGLSPICESGLQDQLATLVKSGRLKARYIGDVEITENDAIIICVQTPVHKNKVPDLSFLLNAVKFAAQNLKKGALLVVCSTIPPGTMNGQIKPLVESITNLSAEHDFYLAYVPERIAPGNALKELVENARLVGGVGPTSTVLAAQLFRSICKNIIETDVVTAEIAKLAENTFRDINIAFANQLALICEHHNADVAQVIKLANTHPRVFIHSPGPGVGGPCLTKDPYLLSFGVSGKRKRLITAARQLNDYMPKHIVDVILSELKKTGASIDSCKIAILGTAYKANVSDSRFSPSKPIIVELLRLGAKVLTYDPFCEDSFGAEKVDTLASSILGVDCVVILTDHAEFKAIDALIIAKSAKKNALIVDAKRLINEQAARQAGLRYYAIGYQTTGD